MQHFKVEIETGKSDKGEVCQFAGALSQIILPQLRCSEVFRGFLCLITFLCAVNHTSLTKNFKSILGFCDRTTYKTAIKIAIYLFKNTFLAPVNYQVIL